MAKKKANLKKANLIAEQILEGLREYAEDLGSGMSDEEFAKKYHSTTYLINPKPSEYGPAEVKRVREDVLHAGQRVFACFLGVSVKTVQSWEQGKTTPSRMAARFMDEIQSDPPYWQKKLSDHIRPKELAET